MESILAFDVSKRATAFGFGRPDQVPVTGLERFNGSTPDEVWIKAAVWISGVIGVMKPDIIAIEAKIQSTGNSGLHTDAETQEILWGLQTVFRMYARIKTGRNAVLVASSTARKTLTGKGTYSAGEAKLAVQAEVTRRGWLSVEDMQPDKADALAVWCHVAADQLPSLKHGRPAKSNVVRLVPERAF